MGITYNKKLMFHRPAEKDSFCNQLTGRVAGEEKVMEKKSSRAVILRLSRTIGTKK